MFNVAVLAYSSVQKSLIYGKVIQRRNCYQNTYSRSGGDLLARLYCISILLSITSTYLTVPYLLGVNNF